MLWKISKYIVIAAVLLLYVVAYSQPFSYRFRNWSSSQGLGSTTVLSIAKTDSGYLWAGTANGLHTFNGSRFHNASISGQKKLDAGQFNVLHAALDGSIWAGVNHVGIAMHAPGGTGNSWQWFPFHADKGADWPASAVIRAIQSDKSGTIWLATENQGLYSLNPSNGATRRISIDSTKVKFFKSIRTLYLLDSATLLVGMVNNLILLDIASGKLSYPDVKFTESSFQPSYWHFAHFSKDTLLAGTDRGLFFLNPENWTLSRYRAPEKSTFKSDLAIKRVLHFSGNECWLGTDGHGLLYVNLQTGAWGSAMRGSQEAIASARIHDLIKDKQGFIWVSHDLGLSCYDPAFNLIVSHELPSLETLGQQVLAAATPAGDIWFAGSQGVGKFSAVNNKVSAIQIGFPSGLRDRAHLIWHTRYGPVVITRSGIWQVDTIRRHFLPLISWNGMDREIPVAGSGMDTIIGRANHVFIDTIGGKEHWWIAHAEMNRLPYFLPAEQRMGYHRSLGLANNNFSYGTELNRFAKDGHGGLWVASETRGLFYLPDPRVDSSLNFWDGASGARRFPFNTIKDLYFDKNSKELWATIPGTGLARIDWRRTDSLRYEIFGRAEGLQHLGLLRIVPVGDRYFFMSSTNGIHFFDRRENHFFLLNWRFGIKSSMFLSGFGDYKADRCWFATPGHVVSFHPMELLQMRVYEPQLALFTWQKGQRAPVGEGAKLVQLSFESRDLLVEPELIDFQQAGNYLLQYRLTGYDKDWNTIMAGTQIAYSTLPGGKYRFECRLLDGARQIGPVYGFQLIVSTPFYRSPWFFLTIAALIVAAIFMRLRYLQQQKVMQLKHQHALLKAAHEKKQALASERERITADLHDDVGATLSSLNIYGEVVQAIWDNDPEKSKEIVGKMASQSRELMFRMSDIIWSMQHAGQEKNELAPRIRNFAQELLSGHEVEIALSFDEEMIAAISNPWARKHIILIIKEALNNIAKYSKATKVHISIANKEDHLLLQIIDNGMGFDESAIVHGNGLKNMKMRCQQMGGTFQVHAAPFQGTAITCTAPLAIISKAGIE